MLRSLKGDQVALSVESVSGANPAAGIECSITVPTGEKWLLLGVSVANVQAGAGSSWPTLIVDDGTNIIWAAKAGTAAQAVSTTCQYSWSPSSPLTIAGATTAVAATGPLAEGMVLPAGYRIRTVTVGIGANTDYGVPWAAVIKL